MNVIAYVKEHPVKTGLIVFGGGLVLILLWRMQKRGDSGGGQSYNPNADPAVINAEIAAGAQHDALAAQAQIAANKIQGDYNIATLSAGVQTALATLQAHTAENVSADQLQATLAQTEAQRQISLTGISAQQAVQQAGIAAQVATTGIVSNAAVSENAANNQTAQLVAQMTNATAVQLGAIQGQVAITQSNNQTLATVEQTWAAEKIAKGNQSAGMFGSALGAIGGIVGALI